MKILFLVVSLFVTSAQAFVDTTKIASLISCNSTMNHRAWKEQFTETFGKPVRKEGGALWWRASGSLFGSEITEIFLTDTPTYGFVGAVFKDRPDVLVKGIQTSRLFPTKVYPTNQYWVGSDGRMIMWHKGRVAKVFCLAGGMLPNKIY